MTLAEEVARRVATLARGDAPCLVAVSGGPDSVALLDLLVTGQPLHRRVLIVAHIDHGIDDRSGEVAGRVVALVRRLAEGAPGLAPDALVRRLALGPATSETAARHARRTALRALATEAGAGQVILGHHADDQAETVLLRLLRGSGPAGLAGMAARRGIWLRPLLRVRRAVLRAHLASRGFDWWDDPANRDPRHLRSWLRAEILPRLAERLPDACEQLLMSAGHAAMARAGWDAVPEALAFLSLQQEKRGISVAALPFREYSSPLRTALLGTLGRRFGVSLGRRRIAMIDRLLAAGDGHADLDGRLEAELAFGRLHLRRRLPLLPAAVTLEDGISYGDRLFRVRTGAAGAPERSAWSTWLPAAPYLVRSWRAGDRIRPLGGRGSRPVGVLLKEARIAPGERPAWPVVTAWDSATILWVPGICRSDEQVPEPGATAIHVECAAG